MSFDKSKYLSLLDKARNVDECDWPSVSDTMDLLHEAMMMLDKANEPVYIGAPQTVDMQDISRKMLGMG